jgi:AraC-like DNA-binding protein
MLKKEKIPGYLEFEPLDAGSSWMLNNFRPYLRQSGNQWRPRWHISARKLLDYLLVFVASGEGVFSLDGKVFPVAPGEAVLIPPDTSHSMSGTSEKMHCIYLHFDLIYDPERSSWDACIPAGTLDLSPFKEFIHPEITEPFWGNLKGKLALSNPNVIKALMIRICSLHSSCKSANALRISGILLELLAEIHAQVLENEQKTVLNHEKLTAAASYINEHPELSINIKTLAKKAGLSESHFRRLFHQLYGISPKTMHLQVRIRKSCELLTYWNMNVSETAEQLNFPSIYSFSRTFKNILGISPTQYQKNIS